MTKSQISTSRITDANVKNQAKKVALGNCQLSGGIGVDFREDDSGSEVGIKNKWQLFEARTYAEWMTLSHERESKKD